MDELLFSFRRRGWGMRYFLIESSFFRLPQLKQRTIDYKFIDTIFHTLLLALGRGF
jgi:hypothetical protein